MRRLFASAIVTLFSVFGLAVPVHAAQQRFISVDIFEPAATSSRTLNVEYKVISTLESDSSFGVQLYENSALKSTQEISHPYGDSGKFEISLPATGTYSYFVRAINHNDEDSAKDSKTVTVQITNAPEPIVTTVFVNNGATAGTGGAGAAGVSGGQAAGAATGTNGQVSDQAASTTNGANDAKDVLGSETTGNKNNNDTEWLIGGLIVLVVAGVGYYILIFRRNREA